MVGNDSPSFVVVLVTSEEVQVTQVVGSTPLGGSMVAVTNNDVKPLFSEVVEEALVDLGALVPLLPGSAAVAGVAEVVWPGVAT